MNCPKCGGKKLEKARVEGNLRSEYSWAHDALRCKKCGCEFTVWD